MMLKTIMGNIRYISNAYHESKLYTTIIVVLYTVVNCMPAIKTLLVGNFIDDATLFQNSGAGKMVLDACLIISAYLVENILFAILNYLNFKFMIILNNGMEDKFYFRLSQIKYAVFEDNDSNDLIYRVKVGIESKFTEGFSKILELLGLFTRAGSMLFIVITKNAWIGFVLLIVFFSLIPLYREIGRDNYEAFTEANKAYRQARNFRQILSEREYANEREIFDYSDFFNKKWKERYIQAIRKSENASRDNHIKILVVTAAVAALTTLLSGVLIPALLDGTVTIGVYIVIVTQLYSLVHFMSWNFSYIVDELSENGLYLDDFDAFLKLDTMLENHKEKNTIKDPVNIRFENVSFKYPGCDEYTLKDISFEFQHGKHYAIVGENGAGKSTLIKLLLGLYDEYEGKILINNTDVKDISQVEIHSVISAVFQDYAKYSMSIKENILFQDSSNSQMEQRAEGVLRQLGLWDQIRQLKNGICTSLGKIDDDGVDFSGGQWQKIALARSAISNAFVYILDEPSNSLDPISERDLYMIYNNMFKSKTTVLITHRLGSTKYQDEILVLDGGRLIEHGSHEELMRQGSAYHDMYLKQRSWYYDERE